jgi:hypothetical protein
MKLWKTHAGRRLSVWQHPLDDIGIRAVEHHQDALLRLRTEHQKAIELPVRDVSGLFLDPPVDVLQIGSVGGLA